MKSVLTFLILWMTQMSFGQSTLSLYVNETPPSHTGEDIFVSGNFNNWDPGEEAMKLSKNAAGIYSIKIKYDHIPGDRLEYKFTRGSWQKSECTATGKLTGPRLAKPYSDTIIRTAIAGWRDDFPASTASENVHVLQDSFYMPQLDRYRKIWIYLPGDYTTSDKRYPVLYMQDGQHLFDEATSRGRIGPIEWAVDETLDARIEAGIIVALDHNPDMKERIPEFYFHPTPEYPEVMGKAYLAFIVNTLKPYVDRHYRTLTGTKNTGIAGSSLGGLISLYGALKYPDTFGWAGIFSPSIWLDNGHIEEEITQLKDTKALQQQHYFFYSGKNENREKKDGSFVKMTDDVNRVIHLLQKKAHPDIEQLINPHGRHGALYWREAFPIFYEWLMKGEKEYTQEP